ncbi:hypothetical protein EKD16_22700 [Streptomonospora litoralis]|uniref:Uncharacterized protein n=1 Tax=Streptomonospora litoralis TaxID=2498135 RepID=A0A4P6Q6I9_9ACTN|nr:hypothetical protein EKD16_22700 [Streptomonospora litoralis]
MDISWRDLQGSMKSAALWLVQEVGEGNIFTKEGLRAAFPDKTQIDRRVRELRKHGWVINTSKEEPALEANEQRFVKEGRPVWEAGQATLNQGAAVSAAERRRVMERDGHMCQSCGIVAGDAYADDEFSNAQLTIARRKVSSAEGGSTVELVTECDRCRIGGRAVTADPGYVIQRAGSLKGIENEIFRAWVAAGEREFSKLELLWGDLQSLPPESRAEAKEAILRGGSGGTPIG